MRASSSRLRTACARSPAASKPLPGELEARAALVEAAALPGQQSGDPVRLHLVAGARRAEGAQRLGDRLGVALPQQRLGVAAEHLERLARRAGFRSVAQRAQRLVDDRGRAQVQFVPRMRRVAAQAAVQAVAEQLVQPHRRPGRVENGDEQVVLDQLFDHRQAVDAPAQLRTAIRIEFVEHAAHRQEGRQLRRKLGEHLLGQVFEHLPVARHQALDRRGRLVAVAGSQQPQSGDPALRAPDPGLRQRSARRLAEPREERRGLVGRKAQPRLRELGQQARDAAPRQRQARRLARGHHAGDVLGQQAEEVIEPGPGERIVDHVQVVPDPDEAPRLAFGQPVGDLGGGRARAGLAGSHDAGQRVGVERLGVVRQRVDRIDQHAEQPGWRAIEAIDRDPGHRPAGRGPGERLRQCSGLAESGTRDDQHEARLGDRLEKRVRQRLALSSSRGRSDGTTKRLLGACRGTANGAWVACARVRPSVDGKLVPQKTAGQDGPARAPTRIVDDSGSERRRGFHYTCARQPPDGFRRCNSGSRDERHPTRRRPGEPGS
ncbi:MAG: hypothetical protein M5U30_07680 [Burkholderiaceae bacterium]|nr:hypothetical protein [Burkholderiaceae bacterium]